MFSQSSKCPYCESYHTGVCPRVKAMEYHENGTLKRVEFHDGGSFMTWKVSPGNSSVA